jgi:hypothetical protein
VLPPPAGHRHLPPLPVYVHPLPGEEGTGEAPDAVQKKEKAKEKKKEKEKRWRRRRKGMRRKRISEPALSISTIH